MKFSSSFRNLSALFFEEVEPTPLQNTSLFAISGSCRQLLNLTLNKETLLKWLNGECRLPGDQRISTRYAGHQFGVWAGQLGDGRAISLGEIEVDREHLNQASRLEIQTKGSGKTPFSRQGDGRAVLRSSVREFVCSEHMHGLNIPTTRALALILSDELVMRESPERAALIARVFQTNLRYGHFEYAFHFKREKELQQLFDYTLKYFFPKCKSLIEMIHEISDLTAQLVAQWMGVGFCHGVMNTDNMSIMGVTFDYGPFGFMEDFEPDWICNHSDYQGRYSYSNQPRVALWNLDRFLWTCSPFIDKSELQKVFDLFWPKYQMYWLQVFRNKLGLITTDPSDLNLIDSLLNFLSKNKLDFTESFRYLLEPRLHYQEVWRSPEGKSWKEAYIKRLESEVFQRTGMAMTNSDLSNIQEHMNQVNPKYVLKNYIAQEIIETVESGNEHRFEQWMEVLTNPFQEHLNFETYSYPTPRESKGIILSCSS